MPSGWQPGTHKRTQGLKRLALGGLLLALLSICVGFQNHCLIVFSNRFSKKTAQVMKSNYKLNDFF